MALRFSSPFGPVFGFDLVRNTRRGAHVWYRCVYGGLLLIVLCAVYSAWFPSQGDWLRGLFVPGTLQRQQLPRFANSFFQAFQGVQIAAVLLLTPICVSGSITEEKERRTLDLLLTTQMRDREIIFGKLAARLGNMVLLLLTGLPVLALTQFLGGVDPDAVLAGFALTLMTLLSLGCVSMMVSVAASTTFRAIVETYLWATGLMIVALVLPGINLLNPVVALYVANETQSSGPVALAQFTVLHAVVHGTVAVICCGVASRCFRRSVPGPAVAGPPEFAPRDAPTRAASTASVESVVVEIPTWEHAVGLGILLPAPRPAIGNDALLWKELQVDNPLELDRMHPLVGVFSFTSVLIGLMGAGLTLFVGVAVSIVETVFSPGQVGAWPSHHFTAWTRVVSTPLAFLIWLMVALHAAGTISKEREQQTLDGLRCLPLEHDELLAAKWKGSLWNAQFLARFLGLVWLLGALTIGLHVVALVFVPIAFAVMAAFVASLGMYFSVTCRTTLQAVTWTGLAIFAVTVTPLLLAPSDIALSLPGLSPEATEWLYRMELHGLSPPAILVTLTVGYQDLKGGSGGITVEQFWAALIGVIIYAAAALSLWKLSCVRFRRMMH